MGVMNLTIVGNVQLMVLLRMTRHPVLSMRVTERFVTAFVPPSTYFVSADVITICLSVL